MLAVSSCSRKTKPFIPTNVPAPFKTSSQLLLWLLFETISCLILLFNAFCCHSPMTEFGLCARNAWENWAFPSLQKQPRESRPKEEGQLGEGRSRELKTSLSAGKNKKPKRVLSRFLSMVENGLPWSHLSELLVVCPSGRRQEQPHVSKPDVSNHEQACFKWESAFFPPWLPAAKKKSQRLQPLV